MFKPTAFYGRSLWVKKYTAELKNSKCNGKPFYKLSIDCESNERD